MRAHCERLKPVKRLSDNHKTETVKKVLDAQRDVCVKSGIVPPQVTLTVVQRMVEEMLVGKYSGVNAEISASFMRQVFQAQGWVYSPDDRKWVYQSPDTISV